MLAKLPGSFSLSLALPGHVSVGHLLSLSRPVLWINTIGPAWVGMWLTGALWATPFFGILLWLTLPFNLLIYGVNDISDMDTDAQNERKGSWEGARICKDQVPRVLAWVTLLNLPFLVYFTLAFDRAALAWIALYTLIFLCYSLPPRFKARRYFDSLSNAAYALPLVFVPLALDSAVSWSAAIGLMLWSVAKHCYDSIQDIEVDQKAGLDTTAIALGKRGALVFCLCFWVGSSTAFYPLMPSLAILNFIYACGMLYSMDRASTHLAIRRLYRVSVAFPYVVGTYGGVALAQAVLNGDWKP